MVEARGSRAIHAGTRRRGWPCRRWSSATPSAAWPFPEAASGEAGRSTGSKKKRSTGSEETRRRGREKEIALLRRARAATASSAQNMRIAPGGRSMTRGNKENIMSVIIREARSGTVLAQGELGSDVDRLRGKLLFPARGREPGGSHESPNALTHAPTRAPATGLITRAPTGAWCRTWPGFTPGSSRGTRSSRADSGSTPVRAGHAAGGGLRVDRPVRATILRAELEFFWRRGDSCVIVLLTSRAVRARLPSDLPAFGPGAG